MNKQKKIIGIVFLLSLSIFATNLVKATNWEPIHENVIWNISAGEFWSWSFQTNESYIQLKIDLFVDGYRTIDMYILNESEYNYFEQGSYFRGFIWENALSGDYYCTVVQAGVWYLVLDNTDALILNKQGTFSSYYSPTFATTEPTSTPTTTETTTTTTEPTTTTTEPTTTTTEPTTFEDNILPEAPEGWDDTLVDNTPWSILPLQHISMVFPVDIIPTELKIVFLVSNERNIDIHVLNTTEYSKWVSNQVAVGYRWYDRSEGTLDCTLTNEGDWYIILDNTDSLATPKHGVISIYYKCDTPNLTGSIVGFSFIIATIAISIRRKRRKQ